MNSLFYARMDAHEFKVAIDLMKEVLTEATFIFDRSKKISVVALDPDKVCHVELCLWMLEEFETQSDENVTLGVFMPNLYKLMRHVKKNHKLEIHVSRKRELIVLVKDEEDDSSVWQVKLNPISTTPYIPRSLSFDHSISMSITSGRLAMIIGSLSVLSPVLHISVKNGANSIIFKAEGPMGSGSYEVGTEKDLQIHKQSGGFQGQFYSKFMDKFCKPAFNRPMELVMAQNQPLQIGYSFEAGKLTMHLMPLQTN